MNDRNAAALDRALGEYLAWKGDPLATLGEAVATDPAFVLGHTTMAALCCLGGVKGDEAGVQASLAAARHAGGMDDRTALHLAGAEAWAAGRLWAAADAFEAAVRRDPRDLLALRLAHDTHFFLGALDRLRDVPLAALPAYDGLPAQAYVRGMAAFGLEEMGAYAEAEAHGRGAVAANPEDPWAVHAVAHVLEMQGRPEEGVAWLRGLEPHWAPALGLAVHNWWHAALYLIELGRLDEALALYDADVRGEQEPMVLNLVDASSLLWRLELAGMDVGQRWHTLRDLWLTHAGDHVLAFNDVHIAMALAGATDEAGLDALEASAARYAARDGGATNGQVTLSHGLPIIRALRAYRAGRFAETVEALAPLATTLAPVGGSNAQRDVFVQTLGLAARRGGNDVLFGTVAAARARLKTGMPLSWRRAA